VAVNGSDFEVSFNGTPIVSGTDPDLVAGRKVGVQSWAQVSDTDENPDPPFWGTEVESIAVTQAGSTLYSQSFAARPVPWRQLVMRNRAATPATSEALGNFGQHFSRPWIYQQSNGFLNATQTNTDFIGPAVAIDPDSEGFFDYEMRVRIGAADNDGVGVLVRVQDNTTFYRINFTNEAMGAGTIRAPRGLSVQKVRDGEWTELFRDDQENPLFVYTPAAEGTTPDTEGFPMFDLSVKAVGDTLAIQVIDHLGNVIDYPLITDPDLPMRRGTVGLATWGTDDVYYTNYGGVPGPLVTLIPEPAAAGVLALAAGAVLLRRSRRSRSATRG
jgi:hypothetical protein